MKLYECASGSLLVVIERGLEIMVELGGLLGAGPRKKSTPWGALMRTIDDQSLAPDHRTTRTVNTDLEVVFVIATIEKLRDIRMMNRRVVGVTSDVEIDPMAAWTRDARRPGDMVGKDIPF